MVGIFFTSVYNVGAAVLRSVGDSKSPFYYLIISSSTNILLDILFVALLPLGVAGVAVATVFAQMISVFLVFRKLYQMDERYAFRFRKMRISWSILKEVMNLGLPAGLQSSITALSAIYLQRYINSFSPAAIAGIGSAIRIDQFAGMPCNAMGLAMTTFIGQNMGPKKYDRTHKGIAAGMLVVVAVVVVFGIPIYFYAPWLMRIFGEDGDMIMYGTGMIHTLMPVYLIQGGNQLFGGVVRGYGYSKVSMLSTIFGMVVVRQIWFGVTLHFDHVIENVYRGYPIGWLAALLPLLLFYFFVIRKKYPPKE